MSTPGNVADFEPGLILRALEAHHVRYVVIGAIAAIAAGAPILTTDLDVTPARSDEDTTISVAERGESGSPA